MAFRKCANDTECPAGQECYALAADDKRCIYKQCTDETAARVCSAGQVCYQQKCVGPKGPGYETIYNDTERSPCGTDYDCKGSRTCVARETYGAPYGIGSGRYYNTSFCEEPAVAAEIRSSEKRKYVLNAIFWIFSVLVFLIAAGLFA